MTILQILAVLAIGIIFLVGGIVTRKKWIIIVATITSLIALSQIIFLVLMGLH